jgi:hypothetical protein
MQGVNPDMFGKIGLEAFAQRIDKAAPDEDPVVKMMAIEHYQKLMAPEEQRRWEAIKIQHSDEIRREMAKYTEDRQDKRDARHLANQPGQILETDQGPQRVRPGSNKAEPIDIGGAHVLGTKGGQGKPQNILAFDADGKQTFEGSAIYDATTKSWSNSATGEAISASRVETTGKGAAGAGGTGGRGGAQVQRQIIAGREIQSDLEAITKLPISVDRGIFGGRQQGPGLFDALKENLAETLTDEDAQLANSALAGLERELSVVTSPVYGGKWAAQSFSALALKPGQTVNVKLYNIARMRQVADNALEGVINTDWVGAQQKKFAQEIRDSIHTAVPWTIQDVIAFRNKGKTGESFSDFVSRSGMKGSAGDGKAGDAAEQIIVNPQTGEERVLRDGQWVPRSTSKPDL